MVPRSVHDSGAETIHDTVDRKTSPPRMVEFSCASAGTGRVPAGQSQRLPAGECTAAPTRPGMVVDGREDLAGTKS